MDKEELVRIGHEVYKMAARLAATEKKTRRTLLTSLIEEKIRDMSNSRRSSLEAGERALAAEALAEWGPGGPPPAIPGIDQLTPYQRHLAVTREASSICDPEDVARRKQMAEPMRKYIRNRKYSKQARKIYGPDWVQPQCLNLELCYEEEFDEREEKYGLKTRQKFGDVVVDTKYQENLEKMVKRHYKKTNFKDVQESVREIRYMFSTNLKREEKKKRLAEALPTEPSSACLGHLGPCAAPALQSLAAPSYSAPTHAARTPAPRRRPHMAISEQSGSTMTPAKNLHQVAPTSRYGSNSNRDGLFPGGPSRPSSLRGDENSILNRHPNDQSELLNLEQMPTGGAIKSAFKRNKMNFSIEQAERKLSKQHY